MAGFAKMHLSTHGMHDGTPRTLMACQRTDQGGARSVPADEFGWRLEEAPDECCKRCASIYAKWAAQDRELAALQTPSGERSTYSIERVTEYVVFIRDLDRGRSVTNDAERVVPELVAKYGADRRLVYQDTMGLWAELARDADGQFCGFYPWSGSIPQT